MRVRNPAVLYYVNDMARAKGFYTRVFQVDPIYESDGYTSLNLGSIVLALHILSAGTAGILPHAGLCLTVDNIEEIQEEVEQLGGRLVEIREARDHIPKIGCFQDPDGNGFELSERRSG
jgi:predicted enzyme related to lactoylglutathione lyase